MSLGSFWLSTVLLTLILQPQSYKGVIDHAFTQYMYVPQCSAAQYSTVPVSEIQRSRTVIQMLALSYDEILFLHIIQTLKQSFRRYTSGSSHILTYRVPHLISEMVAVATDYWLAFVSKFKVSSRCSSHRHR